MAMTNKSAFKLIDWAVRVALPEILDKVGQAKFAAKLRKLKVVTEATVRAVSTTMNKVYNDIAKLRRSDFAKYFNTLCAVEQLTASVCSACTVAKFGDSPAAIHCQIAPVLKHFNITVQSVARG